MTRAAGGNLLALSLASALSVAAQAADEIRSGKWEFTTQMQLPARSSLRLGARERAAMRR